MFSQPLQPPDIDVLRGNWWYIGPRNGHAAIFTADALSRLGADRGLVFHCGDWLHGFGPANATEASVGILAAIGAPYASLRLDAPLEAIVAFADARAAGRVPGTIWSVPAGPASAGRARAAITWHGVLPGVRPLRLRIAVPFLNQVRDGFAAGLHDRGG